jgi:hypothetical protein
MGGHPQLLLIRNCACECMTILQNLLAHKICDQFEGIECVGAQAGSLCKDKKTQLVEYAFQECSKLT